MSANRIGGTTPGAGNLISGNGFFGLAILGDQARENMVQGNFIGTDVTGAKPLGNRAAGVGIGFASENTVGGVRFLGEGGMSADLLHGL